MLVVEETAGAAREAKRTLELAGHEAHTVLFGAPELLTAVEERAWDVVISEWVRQRPGTAELISTVRSLTDGERTRIVVATSKPISSTIEMAFAAGADDFIHKPLIREELLVRIGRARTHALIEAEGPETTSRPVTSLACWGRFDDEALLCLNEMTGRDLVRIPPITSGFSPVHSALLVLAVPKSALEFRVIVEVEDTTLAGIGSQFFDDAAPAILIDLLHEMANTVGGAFMRAGLGEGVEMTADLPSPFPIDDIRPLLEHADARTSVFLRDPAGGRLAVHLTSRERRNLFLPVSKLREGMVLARDLSTEAGTLLLRAGTRITANAAARVAAILGYEVTVEVANAA